MRILLALLLLSIPGLAQPLTIGVKGGLRATSEPNWYGPSESKPYLVGPAVEVRLPHQFAFEIDALYSRLGNTLFVPLVMNEFFARTRANVWEFPLLVKYRLPVRHVQPYAVVGFAPRHASGEVVTTGYTPVTINTSATYRYTDYWHATDHAWVAGGGVEFGTRHLRIAPEVRYLRRNVPANPVSGDLANWLAVPENEVRVMAGIGWRWK